MADIKYERTDERGWAMVKITYGPDAVARYALASAEADDLENQIARRANNRNKKIAAARRERQKKVRNRAHTLYARGVEHTAAWAQAEGEIT